MKTSLLLEMLISFQKTVICPWVHLVTFEKFFSFFFNFRKKM